MRKALDKFAPALTAIADPARRKILALLKERGCCSIGKASGMCACDVEERMKLTQPTVSHHMRVLTRSGLVEAEKIGRWRWYRRNEEAIRRVLGELRESL
jgi:ArsR family transcriptional regulator, arsenate/arsenite/antimonite-responsive transcriptional repressor